MGNVYCGHLKLTRSYSNRAGVVAIIACNSQDLKKQLIQQQVEIAELKKTQETDRENSSVRSTKLNTDNLHPALIEKPADVFKFRAFEFSMIGSGSGWSSHEESKPLKVDELVTVDFGKRKIKVYETKVSVYDWVNIPTLYKNGEDDVSVFNAVDDQGADCSIVIRKFGPSRGQQVAVLKIVYPEISFIYKLKWD